MNKIKKRNTAIELLRIICMVFIILHHYSVHGGFNYDNSALSFNEIFINVISIGGKIACNIFIIITGYFMVNSNFNVQKILKLILKVLVYGILIVTICFGFRLVPLNKNLFIKEIIPIIYSGWFIQNYIIIVLLSPILNICLKILNKKQFNYLIMFGLIIWSIIPTFCIKSFSFSDFDTFLIMYVIGAYIRINDLKFSKNKSFIIFITSFGVILLSTILFTIIGKSYNIFFLVENAVYFSRINSIFCVLSSIFIFIFVKEMNFYNFGINWISNSMLGVYLIHDDRILRNVIWNRISPNYMYQYSNVLILHCITKVTLILLSCIIVDKILDFILEKTIYKILEEKYINSFIKKFTIR